jgi:hypothetical protein
MAVLAKDGGGPIRLKTEPGRLNRMGPSDSHPHLETHDQFQQLKGYYTLGMRRTPTAKAIATGRFLHDKKRFANRKEPGFTGHLGPPPHWLKSKHQRDSWETFRIEIPWLQKSHRALVGIAAVMRADLMAGGEFDVRKANLLRQCLGQMGATPSDASKITMPDEEVPEDPSAKYFA